MKRTKAEWSALNNARWNEWRLAHGVRVKRVRSASKRQTALERHARMVYDLDRDIPGEFSDE